MVVVFFKQDGVGKSLGLNRVCGLDERDLMVRMFNAVFSMWFSGRAHISGVISSCENHHVPLVIHEFHWSAGISIPAQ